VVVAAAEAATEAIEDGLTAEDFTGPEVAIEKR